MRNPSASDDELSNIKATLRLSCRVITCKRLNCVIYKMTLLHDFAKSGFARMIRVGTAVLFLGLLGLTPRLSWSQAQPTGLWNFNPVIELYCVAYSPDGSMLAMGGVGGVTLYNASTTLPYRAIPTSAYIINSIAFSPDGNTIAIGDTYGTAGNVELFNVSTGNLTGSFRSAATAVYGLSFSKNGTLLAVGGNIYNSATFKSTGVLEVWNVASQKRSLSLKTAATTVTGVDISPDGKTLAAGGGNGTSAVLELWNSTTGALLSELISNQPGNVASVAFTPNGKALAAAANLKSATAVQLWNLSSLSLTTSLRSNIGGIDKIAISPDGTELADVGATGYPVQGQEYFSGGSELWSLSGTPSILAWVSEGAEVTGVAFSPIGSSMAVVGTNDTMYALGMQIYDMPTSGFFNILSTHGSFSGSSTITAQTSYWPGFVDMCYPAFSHDSKLVAGGGFDVTNPSQNGQEGLINVWDTAKGTLVGAFPIGLTSGTAYPAFSFDGKHLGISAGGYVKIWNVQTGKQEQSIVTGLTGSFMFSPDGKFIAVSGSNSASSIVSTFDLASGERVSTISVQANQSFTFAISPDSSTIATSGTYSAGANKLPQATLQLWNAATGALIETFATQQSEIGGVAFSPDGTILAAGGYFEASTTSSTVGTLELWNVATKKLLTSPAVPSYSSGLSTLSYAPNGKTLYAFNGGAIQVYDTAKNKMTGYVSVYDVPFTTLSPDGTHLASVYSPGDISVALMPMVTSAPLASLTFSPSTFANGATIGTVTLAQPAQAGGVAVAIWANTGYPTYVSMPGLVTVPAGKKSVSFSVVGWVISATSSVAVEATSGPYTTSTTFTLVPRNLKSIVMSQPTVVGGQVLSANITIDGPAGYWGSDVAIKYYSSIAFMGNIIAVDSGKTTTFFNIYTSVVTSPQTVTITAVGGTVSKTVSFTIVPVGPQSISLSPSSVKAGASSVGTVTLNAPAGSSGVVVTLASSEAAASVPVSITIPAGSTTGTFTITTKAGSGKSTATISASVGTTKTSAKLTIT